MSRFRLNRDRSISNSRCRSAWTFCKMLFCNSWVQPPCSKIVRWASTAFPVSALLCKETVLLVRNSLFKGHNFIIINLYLKLPAISFNLHLDVQFFLFFLFFSAVVTFLNIHFINDPLIPIIYVLGTFTNFIFNISVKFFSIFTVLNLQLGYLAFKILNNTL
jgi:hypothetical protein